MKKKYAVIAVMVITLVFGAAHMFAAPGDENDPLITLSYINEVIMPKITNLINKDLQNTFQVVELEANDKVMCNAGSEFILRMGSATIIATEKGGIANVTAAVDLPNGAIVPSNSHLIVPVSDGRGIRATTKAIIMIKGEYTVEK